MRMRRLRGAFLYLNAPPEIIVNILEKYWFFFFIPLIAIKSTNIHVYMIFLCLEIFFKTTILFFKEESVDFIVFIFLKISMFQLLISLMIFYNFLVKTLLKIMLLVKIKNRKVKIIINLN